METMGSDLSSEKVEMVRDREITQATSGSGEMLCVCDGSHLRCSHVEGKEPVEQWVLHQDVYLSRQKESSLLQPSEDHGLLGKEVFLYF